MLHHVLLPPGEGSAEGEAEFPFLLYIVLSEKEPDSAFFPEPSLLTCRDVRRSLQVGSEVP